MRTEQELVAAANLNFIGSFRKLVEHSPHGAIREIDGLFAFATGLPLSLFNGCVIVGPATDSDFEAALLWIGKRGLPYRIWIDEVRAPDLAGVALAHGFLRDPAPYPGMVLHPVPDAPAPSRGVTVVSVTPADLVEHLEVRVESGLPLDLARRLFSASFAADPEVRLFTVRLDGRPVGASVAIRTDDVAGVYAVGTIPNARRRGVGTAATWAAVTAGHAWGCAMITLQSSEMGYPVYDAMGFRTVVPYATFKRPVA